LGKLDGIVGAAEKDDLEAPSEEQADRTQIPLTAAQREWFEYEREILAVAKTCFEHLGLRGGKLKTEGPLLVKGCNAGEIEFSEPDARAAAEEAIDLADAQTLARRAKAAAIRQPAWGEEAHG
jgi:hypothetical protein